MGKDTKTTGSLVARARDGDELAWISLVEQITPVILATCRSMRLSRDESLDVFGQVCYVLLTHIDRIQSPDRLLSWTATVTRREVLAQVRRSRLFDDYLTSEKSGTDPVESSGADTALQQAEQAELLLRALNRLPSRQRQLIWLLFLHEEQLTYEQIAKKLKMPVASIGPTRQRALERLQSVLRSMGYEF